MLDFDVFADVSGQMLIVRKMIPEIYVWYRRYLLKLNVFCYRIF